MDNGGGATLISYGQNCGDIVNVKVVPEQHLHWIEKLPLMHVDRHRVYVHAGVDPDLPLAAQDPEQLLWKIYKGLGRAARGHAAAAPPSSVMNSRLWPANVNGWGLD
jgi:serine/threonine protein phosphatase 1